MPQHKRWQYQSKAESLFPVAVVQADIGWFQPASVPVRRRASMARYQNALAFDPTPIADTQMAAATTGQVFAGPVVQAQSMAFVPVVERVTTDWLVQHPDPVRREQVQESALAFVPFVAPAPTAIDWLVQHPDPVRPRERIPAVPYQPFVSPETGSFFVEAIMGQVRAGRQTQYQSRFDVPKFAEDITSGWDVQGPVPVRRQRRPEGQIVGGFAPIVSFSWHVPQSDLVRRKRFINEGGTSFVDKPKVSFSWHVPQSDLIRRKVRRLEGGSVFVDKPVVSYGWHVPQSDLVRRKRQINHGGITFVDKPVVSFSWNVPQSDLVRRKRPVNEGGSTFVQAPRVVFEWFQQASEPVRVQRRPQGGETRGEPVTIDIDWLVQHPEPMPRGMRIQSEQVSTGQPDDVTVSFGWFQQASEPRRRPVPPQSAVTEIIRPPDVFPDSWFQQYPEQTRKRPRRPEGGDFRVEVVAPEVVTMDKWYVQQYNPTLRLFRPFTNVVFPVFPHAGVPPIIFEIRDCLLLSDIYFNSLLPLPSGYFAFLEARVPSAFVAPLETLVPSGWVRQETATPWNLAGDALPTPAPPLED